MITWTISPTDSYSTKHTWEAIRNKYPKVQWSSLVWFTNNIPKWAFILWIVCLKKLPTKDRLTKWGMQIDPLCILCSQKAETVSHLFFDCVYSRQIWESILNKFQILRSGCGWENELNYAISLCKGNSFRALVFKLSLAAGVYFIWLERNSRVFGGNPKNPDRILACIAENMRLRICTWRSIPKTVENQRLCDLWCISASLLV